MTRSLGNKALKRLERAARALVTQFQRRSGRGSQSEQPLVLAVTHCHPIRVVLYAAAFQGGWRFHFTKSLRAALDVASTRRPKAVFYDHAAGDPAWCQYCLCLSREGIPFVSVAHKNDDSIFFGVLAAGGYQACGEPLTSEEIVNVVDFAQEVAGLAHVPVKS